MSWPVHQVGKLIESAALALNDGYRVTNAELGTHGTPFVRGGDIGHSGDIDTAVSDHVLPQYFGRLTTKLSRPRVLPYPIAVFDSLVQSQTEATLRVKTYRDGFEKALTFLASIALGMVTTQGGGKSPTDVVALFNQVFGKPISMGTWYELAWRLAAMVPAASTDPAARALRALVTLDGKPSPLMNDVMKEAVQERNVFAHSVTPSSEEVALAEPGLRELWRRFKSALAPLSESRLVVRTQLLDFDLATHTWQYRARSLEGGSDHFRVLDVEVHGELKEQWCYLLRDGAPPLSLAPLVFCAHSDKTSRHEVFVARKLASLEPGAKVDGVGVASTSVMKVG